MKYYQVTLNPSFDVAPRISNWSEKYDTRFINEDYAHKLPRRDLLFVEPNEESVFPSIMSFPFFMVTKKVFDVIQLYEPGIISKQVVLLDGKYAKSETYILPILKCVDCLHSETQWKRDGRTFDRLVLDREKAYNNAIFRPIGLSHTIAIIRLDLAESILRRNAQGVGLYPIDMI